MRDPRLAEIDFLMDLELSRQLSLSCADHDSNTGVGHGDDRVRYGLDHRHFRAMVLDLLLKDLIVGFMPVSYGQERDERDFQAERLDLTQELLKGETIHILKLPRFRGHPKTGVSDAEETTTTRAVPA